MQKTPLPLQEYIHDSSAAKLHVITTVFNPPRYAVRNNLYKAFEKYVNDSGAILYTIECAFGNRPFEVTDANNPHHIQVRTYDELWIKENLLNIGISRLPNSAEYIAWIDADVTFSRPDWVAETIHQLQHHMIVQMFSEAVDLFPDYRILTKHYGWAQTIKLMGINNFVSHYYEQDNKLNIPKGVNIYHPGYAWAARKEAIDIVGGLMDKAILGAADHHMAWALWGEAYKSLPGDVNSNYSHMVLTWQERAEGLHRDVGVVPGTLLHNWHGKKADRRYQSRWDIILKNNFNPYKDVKYDWQGVLSFADPKNIGLRDGIREYFKQRNEDSIDLSPEDQAILDLK